jgi:hypothetical protein
VPLTSPNCAGRSGSTLVMHVGELDTGLTCASILLPRMTDCRIKSAMTTPGNDGHGSLYTTSGRPKHCSLIVINNEPLFYSANGCVVPPARRDREAGPFHATSPRAERTRRGESRKFAGRRARPRARPTRFPVPFLFGLVAFAGFSRIGGLFARALHSPAPRIRALQGKFTLGCTPRLRHEN